MAQASLAVAQHALRGLRDAKALLLRPGVDWEEAKERFMVVGVERLVHPARRGYAPEAWVDWFRSTRDRVQTREGLIAVLDEGIALAEAAVLEAQQAAEVGA